MFCTSFVLVKNDLRATTAQPLRCRSWGCEECAPKRKWRLIMEAASGNPTSLLTLTAAPSSGDTPEERARNLARAWALLRKRAMRRFNLKELPFLAVFEATKKGEPHLHILMRAPFIPHAWISAQMASLTGSPIVDIRKIDAHRNVARYVSKYIGKDPQRFEGTKRYWFSQDYRPRPDDDDQAVMDRKCEIIIMRSYWPLFVADCETCGWVLSKQAEQVFLDVPLNVLEGWRRWQ